MALVITTPTSETTVSKREVRQIARCTKCKTVRSRVVTVETTTTLRLTVAGMRTHRTKRTTVDGASAPTAITCTCNKLVPFWAVDGVTTTTPCDERCTSATGHKCECACGGKNHGAAHG